MRIKKNLPLCLVGALALSIAPLTAMAQIAPDNPTFPDVTNPPTVLDPSTGAPGGSGGDVTDGDIIDTPTPPTTDGGTDGTDGGPSAPGGDDMAGGPDTGGTGGNGVTVPEPSSFLLMSSALGLLWLRRRKDK